MSNEITPYPGAPRSAKEGKPRIPRIPKNINERALKIIDTKYYKRGEHLL